MSPATEGLGPGTEASAVVRNARVNQREWVAAERAAPGALLGSAGDVETWLRKCDAASRERETRGTVWSRSVLSPPTTRT